MPEAVRKPHNTSRILFASAVFVLAVLFFALRSYNGIYFVQFSDEFTHLLGGKVLNAGGRLYQTFVDSHGPTIFMLTQAYGAVFGWSDPTYARLIMVALALLASASVAASPALKTPANKIRGVSLFLGMLAAVWLLQGLYLINFYAVAGMVAVIGLSFLTGIWMGRNIPHTVAVCAGIAFALLIFTAYSYGPSAVLFVISGYWATLREHRHHTALMFTIGGVVGAGAMLIWLTLYSDLQKYFVFHIYFNQTAYLQFSGASLNNFLQSLLPSFTAPRMVHNLALTTCGTSALLFVAIDVGARDDRRRQLLPILVGYVGVLLLNARGLTIFQDATFLIASIGLFAIAVPAALAKWDLMSPKYSISATLVIGGLVAGTEVIGNYAVSSPHVLTKRQINQEPRHTVGRRSEEPFFQKVRTAVGPEERVLALVYRPDFYFSADRLPMDRYYEYLPWDAEYARSPFPGAERDLCVDLARSPPPLIAFDNWKVWGAYAPADFMPCVLEILTKEYRRSSVTPTLTLYLRVDRAIDEKSQ
jgi:hypothetical protein